MLRSTGAILVDPNYLARRWQAQTKLLTRQTLDPLVTAQVRNFHLQLFNILGLGPNLGLKSGDIIFKVDRL
jgi:hypothetical protein